MTYDPTVPNQANLVRTASGDLTLMQGNFEDLAPLVSGTVTSGTAPSAAIRGFYFGDPTNRKRYFIQSDGSDILRVMRNVSGEAAPSWQEVLSLSQVSGEDILLAMKASGQTPTDAAHLATKDYVDTVPTLSGLADTAVSGATSGQIPEWDGSNWVNVNHAHSLNDLTDVAIVSPASGEALVYNGAQWEADALTLSSHLSDVLVSGATSGQVLTSDGAGNWTAEGASSIGMIEGIEHQMDGVVGNGAGVIGLCAFYNHDVKEMSIKSTAGTCTVDIEIDSVVITGLSGIAVSGTKTEWEATSGNSVALGSTLSMTISNAAGCQNLALSLKKQRT